MDIGGAAPIATSPVPSGTSPWARFAVVLAAVVAGAVAALLASGRALAGLVRRPQPPAASATEPSTELAAEPATEPAPATGQATLPDGGGPRGFNGSRPYLWLATLALYARVAGAWARTALTVVFLPVLLGLSRLVTAPANAVARWAGDPAAASPNFDQDGEPRTKRRVAPLWLAFGGFYLILALAIGTAWLSSIAGPGNGDPSANATTRNLIALGSPSHAFTPSGSPMPIASPTSTPKPTASPTPTPKPTKKPPPKPTKKPTPKPTPVNFVTFVKSGGGKTASYTIKKGGTFTWVIEARVNAQCSFSATHNNWSGSAYVAQTSGQISYFYRTGVGSYWAPNTYTLTATCNLAGYGLVTTKPAITLIVTN